MSKVLRVEPQGGLGNRLFTYHYALQVANALGIHWSVKGSMSRDVLWLDRSLFKEISVFPRWQAELHAKALPRNLGDALGHFTAALERRKTVFLRGPILGESFFGSCRRDPRSLVSPPSYGCTVRDPYIAVHFRGGDFFSWNKNAVLPTSYYLKAVEWAMEWGGPAMRVHLVTDDPSLESYKYLAQHLGSRATLEFGSEEHDFCVLQNSSILISSPSTFCIWAGILGDAKIVHSQNWVTERAESNDEFWLRLQLGGSEFYHVTSFV